MQRGLGEQREGEADQAIAAHLQHHAGQDHRAGRGRLHVRVGQPGVEREQRHLDDERQCKSQEEPPLRAFGDRQLVELEQIEAVLAGDRVMHPRQADDRDQHQHAAGHGVEDELDRGVDALVVAPDADQEIHRDQDEVPEDVEQEDVEGAEHADHRRLEQQHEDREFLHLLLDAVPRRQERNRRQEAGQHQQHEAETVDAEVILDAELRNPRRTFNELEFWRAGRGIKAGP
jgi:hypothetical protein